MNPLARQDNLVIEEIWDELVVYDKGDNQVHRLNASAAMVWRHCDGTRSMGDLAAILHERMGLPHDESLVRLALDDLERANLLSEPLPATAGAGISRREMLEQLKVAAYLLPLVASVLAVPSTAAASSATGPSNTLPIFPHFGTFSALCTRGSASCNGDYSSTETTFCTFNSNGSTCTLTASGEPARVCTTTTPPVQGSTNPTATYVFNGTIFSNSSGSFLGSSTTTFTWSANSTCTGVDSRTITGSSGCPAIYTGVFS